MVVKALDNLFICILFSLIFINNTQNIIYILFIFMLSHRTYIEKKKERNKIRINFFYAININKITLLIKKRENLSMYSFQLKKTNTQFTLNIQCRPWKLFSHCLQHAQLFLFMTSVGYGSFWEAFTIKVQVRPSWAIRFVGLQACHSRSMFVCTAQYFAETNDYRPINSRAYGPPNILMKLNVCCIVVNQNDGHRGAADHGV